MKQRRRDSGGAFLLRYAWRRTFYKVKDPNPLRSISALFLHILLKMDIITKITHKYALTKTFSPE